MGQSKDEILPPDENLEKVWFSWSAPVRAFKRQDREFWITCLAILGLVGIIFFFAKDFLAILPACALLFLYYILSTVPPEIVDNKLTNRGIHFGPNFFPWDAINSFSFGKAGDSRAVIFDTFINFFTRQISLIISPQDEETVKGFCLKKLPLVESSPRFIDKLSKRLAALMPFEDKPKNKV